MPDESGKPTLDDLVTQMREQNARATAALETIAQKSAPPSPPPAAPVEPSKLRTLDDIATEFKEHVNSGNADKAFRLAAEMSMQRTESEMIPIREQLAEMNLERLKRDNASRATPERLALFEKTRARYGVPKSDLRNYDTVRDLWTIVLRDDPTVKAEEEAEYARRLAEDRAKWEKENEKYHSPAPLGPITPPLPDNFPKDTAEKYLFPDNPDVRTYLDRQLAAEHFGVSHATYIEQRMKEDDPRATERVGAGPFAKRTWTLIGKPPDTKKGLI